MDIDKVNPTPPYQPARRLEEDESVINDKRKRKRQAVRFRQQRTITEGHDETHPDIDDYV